MSDDRRLPASLVAARSHLRLVAPWGLWIPLLTWLAASVGYSLHLEGRPGIAEHGASLTIGALLVYGITALFGVHRAVAFHPQWDASYRDWLSQTPWSAAKPLPRGPIQLIWPDGLAVGGLVLFGMLAVGLDPLKIMNTAVFLYCLALALLMLDTMTFAPAYLTFFCLGLMARSWSIPWVCGAFGGVSYLVVYWGIRRSLKSFPWIPPAGGDSPLKMLHLRIEDLTKPKLGWPHGRLLAQPSQGPDERTFVLHSLVACALIAWWTSCLFASVIHGPEFLEAMRWVGYILAPIGSLIRLAIYFSGYASPISLLGRITARRLIIPGHDVVFLVFPLAALAPDTIIQIGRALGLPSMVYAPAIPALVLFIVLAAPPGLRQWRLTGRHRIVAAILERDKNYVKVG